MPCKQLTNHSPCISLVARMAIFTSAAAFDADPTWWITRTENWVLAEYASGLICASLIHLKPLVKTLLPFLLGDIHENTKDVERALPKCHHHTYSQLSRGFGRKYGYISQSWLSASLRSKGSGGTIETNGMVKVTTQFEDDGGTPPRTPEKALTWPPAGFDGADASLLRNSSPV